MLSDNDSKILEKIVELDGDCLLSGMCSNCPLKSKCLPRFLRPIPPTREQRASMALSIVTNDALFGTVQDVSEYNIKDDEK